MKIPELLALLCYFVLVLYIGIFFVLKDRKSGGSEKDYFRGGRRMSGWVTALSAGASDMSAWVLMGLPGSIYLYGVGQVWIAVGLLIGTVTAWLTVAPEAGYYTVFCETASLTVDGAPVDVLRADWTLRAAALPAGEHDFVMRFAPASYRTGATISRASSISLILLLLLSIAGLFLPARKKK